jgi:hypothetical protein
VAGVRQEKFCLVKMFTLMQQSQMLEAQEATSCPRPLIYMLINGFIEELPSPANRAKFPTDVAAIKL